MNKRKGKYLYKILEAKSKKIKTPKIKTNWLIFTLGKVRESMPDLPEIRILRHHLKERRQDK